MVGGFRRAAPVAVAASLAASCVGGGEGPAPGVPEGAPTVEAMAAEVGADVLRSLVRGYHPERSGDVVLVTRPGNVMGTWGEGIRSPRDPRTSHASPWSYLARVPIALYGPGHVRAGVTVDRPVDLADIAPTFAELLGYEFDAPDGRVLREALVPGVDPPRVLVLFVHDGGGWNVLERWPDAWPNGARLGREGTVYTNATVGSAPPITTPIHANMGTGTYPRTHGLPEIVGRLPGGSIGEMYYDRSDPVLLESPTVADEWDRANGNRPWMGVVGFEPWHLAMMGKGARDEGGDRDLAVLWDRDLGDMGGFFANEELYALPGYLPGDDALRARLAESDATDGARDGEWRGYDLADPRLIPGIPGFVAHQGDVVREVVLREPIGDDEVTDLLFVNLKSIDEAGHIYNFLAPEFEAVMAAQDAVVGELAALLDEEVGEGEWVMAITADHGQTPSPGETGGLRVDKLRVEEAVEGYFGRDIVETTSPDDLYLHRDAMREAGITVEEVARYVATITYRQVAPPNTDLSTVPQAVQQEPVFAAAFPGDFLTSLTDADIDAVGPSPYPEGNLTSPIRIEALED